MSDRTFERSVVLPVDRAAAFAWHERLGALERLMPPWEPARFLARTGSIHDGDEVKLQLCIGSARVNWLARHFGYEAGCVFRDVQLAGPFGYWEHEHRFEDEADGRCRLTDRIIYRLPLGAGLAGGMIRRKLERMFAWRHRVTFDDLALHARFADQPGLTVAVTGASGFVGQALCSLLTTGGHRVIRLVRHAPASADELQWDPAKGIADPAAFEAAQVDAVAHLAGESVAKGRWTPAKKARILESRDQATRRLVDSLLALARPPGTFVSASAVGAYGDAGDAWVDESSPMGEGFLPEVVAAWEAASRPAMDKGVRVAWARLGVVLDPRDGALAKMLPPFRMGAGGPLGSGRQYMSWVSLNDAARALAFVLQTPSLDGPVNVTAPEPVTNRDFGRALGAALKRPAFAPLPAPVARLMFGEMADAMLLTGARVRPSRLLDAGFAFADPTIRPALRAMLGGHIDDDAGRVSHGVNPGPARTLAQRLASQT